ALGYHLFSWEFCWQSLEALKSAGVLVSTEVQERLRKAGEFYRTIKPCGDPWDYGDSDNAYVTPLFADESHAAVEWWKWFDNSIQSPALKYWWGDFPKLKPHDSQDGWQLFPSSGYALFRSGDWLLRWDISPLGYMAMAPHGHLDALHFSLWFRNEPIIIDPGTGAYYADKNLRTFLADWNSHNGPCLADHEFPKRRGTFLWGGQHDRPTANILDVTSAEAELKLPGARITRRITFLGNGFLIEDRFEAAQKSQAIASTWKFGPQLELRTSPIRLSSSDVRLEIALDGWEMGKAYSPEQKSRQLIGTVSDELKGVPFESIVSPA